MRTSFHHQPEAQHPKSSSYPQAGRPITPSFGTKRTWRWYRSMSASGGKADMSLAPEAEPSPPNPQNFCGSLYLRGSFKVENVGSEFLSLRQRLICSARTPG